MYSLTEVVVQLQAKADAIAEPILKEVPATADAEDGPRGKGANAEGDRDATDGPQRLKIQSQGLLLPT